MPIPGTIAQPARVLPLLTLLLAAPAAARHAMSHAGPHAGPHHAAAHIGARAQGQAPAPPGPDDLYRRRGYGTGGPLFGHTAQAGACAEFAFARPPGCGPKGGYGIYGNGLGSGF